LSAIARTLKLEECFPMPAQPATHPSEETLRALGLGKLDDTEAQAILRHLEICPDCCRKATSLPGDSFLDRLRAVHGRNETPGPAGPFSLVAEETQSLHSPAATGSVAADQRAAGTNPPSFPQQLPAQLGRYRILKLLGKGGMGSVYLTQDTQLDRPVALKIPHFDAADGPQVRERFYREARAAATLRHPGFCPLYDVGEIDGIPYLTMAYLEGKPLAEFARDRPLTPRQSALLVRKLALALHEAHKRGVLHRDLKPANVMIDKRGEPIIMDFGLARRIRTRDPRLTQRGSLLGTPAYMSPEQVAGDIKETGPASDVYSLGVILYELLTGRLPFIGDAMAMLSKILMDEPPPPSAARPDLDPELEAICLKAMAKKIENRYGSMADFAEALTFRLRTKLSASEPAALAPKPARRRRIPPWAWLIGAGVGLALLLLLGLCAVSMFRVKTKDGILVVAVNEPNTEVYLDGARMTVSWGESGKKAEIHVKPGTHDVEIKKDGFSASGRKVTLEEGDRETVAVWLEKLPPKELGQAAQVVEVPKDRGELIHEIHWERRGSIYTANFSPDGRHCLISGDSDVTLLYDLRTGQPVGQRMKGYISVFMPGGKEILAGARPGSVFHVYDLDGGKVREFHGKDLLDNFWLSPRGDRLLTSSPGVHRLLDMKDGQVMKTWACDPNVTFTFFSPDGRYLFRLVDGILPWQVYRTDDGEQIKAFENLTGIDGLRGFFPDGKRVFGRTDNWLYVYDVSSGRKLEELDLGRSYATAVTLSPDGKRILAAHNDHHVRLWDLARRRELCSFPVWNVNKVHYMSLNFSADGQYGCAGGWPGWAYLWRLPRP
jgi:WD40 repeat protein